MTGTVVRLAGREFAVRPLTLGQLRQVLDVIGDLAGKTGGDLVQSAARIIHAGLSRAEAELTLDAVLAMEASLDEVNAAVSAILKCAGLVSAAESGPAGEAVPVATVEPSSPASTAPSPPAAATPIP